MNDKSRRIALGGIASAVSLLFAILGYYFEALTVTLNVCAAFGLMLPLSRNYYRESLLGWIGVSVIGFLIINTGIVPFIMVGGGYTVFTVFWENKKYKYLISIPIKFGYSLLVFFILYKVTSFIAFNTDKLSFMQGVNGVALYILLNIAFSALFLAYDYALLFCYRYFKAKIFPKIIK